MMSFNYINELNNYILTRNLSIDEFIDFLVKCLLSFSEIENDVTDDEVINILNEFSKIREVKNVIKEIENLSFVKFSYYENIIHMMLIKFEKIYKDNNLYKLFKDSIDAFILKNSNNIEELFKLFLEPRIPLLRIFLNNPYIKKNIKGIYNYINKNYNDVYIACLAATNNDKKYYNEIMNTFIDYLYSEEPYAKSKVFIFKRSSITILLKEGYSKENYMYEFNKEYINALCEFIKCYTKSKRKFSLKEYIDLFINIHSEYGSDLIKLVVKQLDLDGIDYITKKELFEIMLFI